MSYLFPHTFEAMQRPHFAIDYDIDPRRTRMSRPRQASEGRTTSFAGFQGILMGSCQLPWKCQLSRRDGAAEGSVHHALALVELESCRVSSSKH